MDIFSHGLWGGISLGRSNKKLFIWSFVFGIAPDLITFGWFFIFNFNKFYQKHTTNEQTIAEIPSYIFELYNLTHSLIPILTIIAIIFVWQKKIITPLLAWPLHILMDIPTHSLNFFPTPFAWPLFDLKINGTPWPHPLIFIPNWIALITISVWLYLRSRKQRAP